MSSERAARGPQDWALDVSVRAGAGWGRLGPLGWGHEAPCVQRVSGQANRFISVSHRPFSFPHSSLFLVFRLTVSLSLSLSLSFFHTPRHKSSLSSSLSLSFFLGPFLSVFLFFPSLCFPHVEGQGLNLAPVQPQPRPLRDAGRRRPCFPDRPPLMKCLNGGPKPFGMDWKLPIHQCKEILC